MAIYLNNKGRIIFNSKLLAVCFMLCAGILLCWIFYLEKASSGPYTNSAHGDTGYGVKRDATGFPLDYAKGNCAHCHEQHAMIGGVEPEITGGPSIWLLFVTLYVDQNTGFCLRCHRGPTNSLQTNMIDQYSYSYKFGGDSGLNCPSHIRQAFNFVLEGGTPNAGVCSSDDGSAHHLTTIRSFLQNKWGFGNTLDNINPCSGCHNPHRAQRHSYPIGSNGTSPISLPSTHDGDWNVYGDDTNERMNFNNPLYQAPYYYNSIITYEPDGDATSDGSNMPDYITFCTDCHNTTYNNGGMSSTQVVQFRGATPNWIQNPNWNTNPHGGGNANNDQRRTDPYKTDGNYVLSCTDCHEPHGSPNRLLIRKEINGTSTVNFTTWNDKPSWLSICQRCHDRPDNWWNNHQMGQTNCGICHRHDPNYSRPI